uniref:Uncharacterized protein n=1 Tax=Osugoroshi virus TaxID=2202814 RepID=A0A7R7T1P0_9VIRU|nr:hypothetical protein [Osugoroshi virus]
MIPNQEDSIVDIELFKRSLPSITSRIYALIQNFCFVMNTSTKPSEQVKAMKMLYHLRYRYYISTADSSPEACKFKSEYVQAFPSLAMTTPSTVDLTAPKIDWGETIELSEVEDSGEDRVDKLIEASIDTSEDDVEIQNDVRCDVMPNEASDKLEHDVSPSDVEATNDGNPSLPDAPEELEFELSDDERVSLSSDDSWSEGSTLLPAQIPSRIHVRTLMHAVERKQDVKVSIISKGEAVAKRMIRHELKIKDVDRAYLFKGPNDVYYAAYQQPSGEVLTVTAMAMIAEMSGLSTTYVLKRGRYRQYLQACEEPTANDLKMYADTLDWIKTMKFGPLQ